MFFRCAGALHVRACLHELRRDCGWRALRRLAHRDAACAARPPGAAAGQGRLPERLAVHAHYIHQPGVARLARWGLLDQVIAPTARQSTHFAVRRRPVCAREARRRLSTASGSRMPRAGGCWTRSWFRRRPRGRRRGSRALLGRRGAGSRESGLLAYVATRPVAPRSRSTPRSWSVPTGCGSLVARSVMAGHVQRNPRP